MKAIVDLLVRKVMDGTIELKDIGNGFKLHDQVEAVLKERGYLAGSGEEA